MNTFFFQPGMTWGKLGFAFYSDSLSYRKVLDQNPSWNVMELPAPGTPLTGSIKGVASGGISQQPSVFSQGSGSTSLNFFPFSNAREYYSALSRYSPSSLTDVDRVNGYSSDSYAIFPGAQ